MLVDKDEILSKATDLSINKCVINQHLKLFSPTIIVKLRAILTIKVGHVRYTNSSTVSVPPTMFNTLNKAA